jgi:hypothetical protein
VVAGATEAPFIWGEQAGPAPLFTAAEQRLFADVSQGLGPAVPSRPRGERRRRPEFGGGARVLSVPGHTSGSIALYLPEHRVLTTVALSRSTGSTVSQLLGPTASSDRRSSLFSGVLRADLGTAELCRPSGGAACERDEAVQRRCIPADLAKATDVLLAGHARSFPAHPGVVDRDWPGTRAPPCQL